jgi:hypothetical protein
MSSAKIHMGWPGPRSGEAFFYMNGENFYMGRCLPSAEGPSKREGRQDFHMKQSPSHMEKRATEEIEGFSHMKF